MSETPDEEGRKSPSDEPLAPRVSTTIDERGRGDVSATTIGRMMGLATVSDLGLLDKKIELLTSKFNLAMAKIDKIATTLQQAPSGSDLERIDVQIGALKVLIKDVLTKSVTQEEEGPQERELGSHIVSSDSQGDKEK